MVRVQCRSNSGSGIAVPTRRRRGPDTAAAQIQQRQRGSKRRGAWIRWRQRRSDSDIMDLAVATQSGSASSDPNGD
ncbi:hypothetical protein GUJ93_ZPchr0004g40289 [Zizania palustris]|uniref:Uncharacterized protein n=1 Tax=Zizania palustris TaxID=103762 RepID=A0A8J5T0J4_ZIZPA|nr:hypothetical protein GUJ93_ZPchr0004g40289 [Zizania palustris]